MLKHRTILLLAVAASVATVILTVTACNQASLEASKKASEDLITKIAQSHGATVTKARLSFESISPTRMLIHTLGTAESDRRMYDVQSLDSTLLKDLASESGIYSFVSQSGFIVLANTRNPSYFLILSVFPQSHVDPNGNVKSVSSDISVRYVHSFALATYSSNFEKASKLIKNKESRKIGLRSSVDEHYDQNNPCDAGGNGATGCGIGLPGGKSCSVTCGGGTTACCRIIGSDVLCRCYPQ